MNDSAPEIENLDVDDIRQRIGQCLTRDQFTLRRLLNQLRNPKRSDSDETQKKLLDRFRKSIATADRRREHLPSIVLDESLPIFEKQDEIADAINKNPVVVISGETGSGKSTQLPLIAMKHGYGVKGLIGHTQPRRIAARSIASRVASQLESSLGKAVGFKIRFDDKTGEDTYLKLMTDGILLAETQSDRFLDQYEVIIIDEAHERSLNIDFLIGNLKRILEKRRNLKVIVTSATIDTQRFAEHFVTDGKQAPVINVEGRTYPVEVRYQGIEEVDQTGSLDPDDHIANTIKNLAREETGDMLVFLPTEKDIRTISRKLKGLGHIDVLPLYARLSTAQQNAIFETGKKASNRPGNECGRIISHGSWNSNRRR